MVKIIFKSGQTMCPGSNCKICIFSGKLLVVQIVKEILTVAGNCSTVSSVSDTWCRVWTWCSTLASDDPPSYHNTALILHPPMSPLLDTFYSRREREGSIRGVFEKYRLSTHTTRNNFQKCVSVLHD